LPLSCANVRRGAIIPSAEIAPVLKAVTSAFGLSVLIPTWALIPVSLQQLMLRLRKFFCSFYENLNLINNIF
jgi:hypothetical protein